MRGTLLNTATVAVGASLGMLVGSHVPPIYQQVALSGIGLVVLGIGMKMFFQSKNVIIVLASIAIGGVLGTLLGIAPALANVSEWMRQHLGGASHFNEGLITCTVLFCVGPLTLLGCIQDGLDGNIELLSVKSTLDGISAFFFATALGAGVLVSALFVLVIQGTITLFARSLRSVAKDEEFVNEASATGGILMLAIGLGLLSIKSLPTANYLPAIALAPLLVAGTRKYAKRQPDSI